jgi:DNA-binding protein
VGNEATLCLDLTGLNLSPENGTLSLHAPKRMSFSFDPQSIPQQKVDIPYNDGKLWNQTLYLHFIPVEPVTINSALILTNENQVREIPVKAIGKEISRRTEVALTHTDVLLKGMKKKGDAYTIDSDVWPADIDENGNRYVEFILRNSDKTLVLTQLSFILKGNPCFRIAFARGKDFYPRMDIAERQKGDSFSDKLVFPVNVTINPKERLHIRIFPWNPVGGKMDFQIVDWGIRGIEVE